MALFAVGVVAELGSELHVKGASYVPLPWKLVTDLPVANNVLPVRFSLYVALVAAVAVALWAAAPHPATWIRVALTAGAVAAILPHPGIAEWRTQPTRPAFFTSDLYRACLRPNEQVLVLPYPSWGDSTLWQAETGFRFRLTTGSLSPEIPEGVPDLPLVRSLVSRDLPAGGGDSIVAFARRQGATAILVDGARAEPWRTALERAGRKPRLVGGVFLDRLEGAAPGHCA
jgi:hypothetical protein